MKITLISDTHNKHRKVEIPEADMIIHAGDISVYGGRTETRKFLKWFSELPHKYKIFIAGNHDYFFQNYPEEEVAEKIPDDVIYLNDSGCTIEGINIWGSPIQPFFKDWAFQRHEGADIQKHWDLIPTNTDILITHGPPFEILDLCHDGNRAGCKSLLDTVKKVKPKLHVFGHIHEAYGTAENEHTKFVNASVVTRKYVVTNAPVVWDFPA